MTTALLDACVLFPASLRDLFMRLAVSFTFQPKWTDRIHEEWIQNLLESRPDLSLERLEATRRLMDKYGRDCLVIDYDHHIANLTLPDEDDRHVLAARLQALLERLSHTT